MTVLEGIVPVLTLLKREYPAERVSPAERCPILDLLRPAGYPGPDQLVTRETLPPDIVRREREADIVIWTASWHL